MSGNYTVPMTPVAVTVPQDLFEIVGHASKPYIVIGFRLGQKTEAGDAQEEMLHIAFKSGQTVSGTGGSAVTPEPRDTANTVAAGFTAEKNNITTKAGTGTILTHDQYQWDVRNPLEILIPEEFRILQVAGRRCTIELVDAPVDSITIFGEAIVQEIG